MERVILLKLSNLLNQQTHLLTTNGDLFAVARGNAVDVRQHPEPFPRLQQQLEDVARVQLLLGEKLISKTRFQAHEQVVILSLCVHLRFSSLLFARNSPKNNNKLMVHYI